MRKAAGVALEIGKARVQVLALHGKWVRNVQGDEFARGNQAIIRDRPFAGGYRSGPLIAVDALDAETRMEPEHNRHGIGAEIGDNEARFQLAFRELVRHLVLLRERPLRHQVGVLPELEPAGDVGRLFVRLYLGHLPKRRRGYETVNGTGPRTLPSVILKVYFLPLAQKSSSPNRLAQGARKGMPPVCSLF